MRVEIVSLYLLLVVFSNVIIPVPGLWPGFLNCKHRKSYFPSLHSKNDLSDLFQSLGERKLLNEFSQYIGKVSGTLLEWNDDKSVTIRLGELNFTYSHDLNSSTHNPLTVRQRKEIEFVAIREVLNRVIESPLNGQLASYLSKRLNKDNVPSVIRRSQLPSACFNKSVVIFVDVENIPDFRKCLFISKEGDIRFAFPTPPPILTAPSIFTGSSLNNAISEYPRLWEDDEILILTYAHAKGPQHFWANRLTSNEGKDAADGKSLQLLQHLCCYN